jgi:hypothetical protein
MIFQTILTMLRTYLLIIIIYAGIALLKSELTRSRQILSSASECEVKYNLHICAGLDRYDLYYQLCKKIGIIALPSTSSRWPVSEEYL